MPSKFQVCFGGNTPDGELVPADLIRNALPAEARELLAPVTRASGMGATTPSGDSGCAVVGPDDARAIDGSLQAAGFGPADQGVAVSYVFNIPPAAGRDAIVGGIAFISVLPNGDAEGGGA